MPLWLAAALLVLSLSGLALLVLGVLPQGLLELCLEAMRTSLAAL